MFSLFIFLIAVFASLGIGGLAALSDFRSMTIPNSYSIVVAVLFVVSFGVLQLTGNGDVFLSFYSHLLGGVIVFLVTLGMFALGGIGAGDSKLGTAFALWVGLKGLMPFLFYMALFGGLLGVVALYLKKAKPIKNPLEGGWIARVQAGESKVPYGMAILIGALASFVKLGYLSPEVFALFLS